MTSVLFLVILVVELLFQILLLLLCVMLYIMAFVIIVILLLGRGDLELAITILLMVVIDIIARKGLFFLSFLFMFLRRYL